MVEFAKIEQAVSRRGYEPPVWRKGAPLDRAVVAWVHGKAQVLYHIGPQLAYMLDQCGAEFYDSADEPPADGIWVWEGKIRTSHSYEYPLEVDEWLEGAYRAPTKEE